MVLRAVLHSDVHSAIPPNVALNVARNNSRQGEHSSECSKGPLLRSLCSKGCAGKLARKLGSARGKLSILALGIRTFERELVTSIAYFLGGYF